MDLELDGLPRCLISSTSNGLYIGTSHGLFMVQIDTLDIHSIDLGLQVSVNELIYAGLNQFVVGTDRGVMLLDSSTGSIELYRHIPGYPSSLSSNVTTCIFLDFEDRLWIGTLEGLNLFNPAESNFKRFFHRPLNEQSHTHDEITRFHQHQPGLLWIGTHRGLSTIDTISRKFETVRIVGPLGEPLVDNYYRGFHEDEEGRVWVGTQEGLAIWDRKFNQFDVLKHDPKNANSIPSNTIWQIVKDLDGQVWLGTSHGLAKKTGKRTFRVFKNDPADPQSLSGDRIYCLLEYDSDWLMLGTRSYGLNLFHKKEERAIRFEIDPRRPDRLAEGYIRCLYRDSKGRTWIGSNNGILHLYNNDFESFEKYYPEENQIDKPSFSSIFCISEDRNGVIWLGRGEGLQRLEFNGGSIHVKGYLERDGLPNNSIYGILEDDQGFLWLSSNNGLSRFDPIKESFRNFSFEDGLQGNEFNLNSFFKLRSGELLFGGVEGFNVIRPDSISQNPFLPPVSFTELKVNNKVISIGPDQCPVEPSEGGQFVQNGDRIRLTHEDRLLTLAFAALSFAAPERNRFAYQLEGFDPEWVESGAQNQV